MPHWIPRADMPQVDEADLTALVEWLAWKGVAVAQTAIPSASLRFHQEINWRTLHSMPQAVYDKPILVASDNGIIDGNHRAALHRRYNAPCPALQLALPFSKALPLVESFAGTYHATSSTPQTRN